MPPQARPPDSPALRVVSDADGGPPSSHPATEALARALGQVPPAEGGPSPAEVLAHLRSEMLAHPLWTGPLLSACRAGHLTREDLCHVLGQQALFVRSSTRLLHALRVRCESEALRARLMQHLCEESGAVAAPPGRLQRFGAFLREAFGLEVEGLRFEDAAHYLVRESLDFCLHASPAAACAFLALGTEALLPRLYATFLEGLRQQHVEEAQLRLFHAQLEEDGRAATLAQLVLACAGEPGWEEACRIGMQRALVLHAGYFDTLSCTLQQRRLEGLLCGIQARQSLAPPGPAPEAHRVRDSSTGEAHYRTRQERHGVDFTLTRLPLRTEVLEPCVLRIPPGRSDEWRQQAPEALLVVLRGEGQVCLEETRLEVRPGDIVFIPRWARHQVHSGGEEELVLLCVSDAGLTRRVWPGDSPCSLLLRRETGSEHDRF